MRVHYAKDRALHGPACAEKLDVDAFVVGQEPSSPNSEEVTCSDCLGLLAGAVRSTLNVRLVHARGSKGLTKCGQPTAGLFIGASLIPVTCGACLNVAALEP